ncbi:hypothetical protein LX16_0662 [Stackebrandtia albiflava]|uniref:DUF4878 domain-containing protein n=1 Tax=Stackebrandtia albiflava TaxID=406432 RepID=A0A562VAY0_9ACTN|nr:hypothetical protein [Stackebrandtia albiflava]TWJ14967.1 hypothetical protein LX16_0662 [Stackebrandtia albiflava]
MNRPVEPGPSSSSPGTPPDPVREPDTPEPAPEPPITATSHGGGPALGPPQTATPPADGPAPAAGPPFTPESAPVTDPARVPDAPVSAPRHLGTRVPFAAPPRDRDRNRLTLLIVLAAVAAVLLCGGGIAGGVVALTAANEEIMDRTRETAARFMDAIVAGELEDAYSQTCEQLRDDLTASEFASEWRPMGVSAYELRPATDAMDGSLLVPVEAQRRSGPPVTITLTIVMGQQSMEMEVCGWRSD